MKGCGFFWFTLLLVAFSSCGSKKRIASDEKPNILISSDSTRITELKTDSIYNLLKIGEQGVWSFSAKINANSTIDKQSNSFTSNVRIVLDSAIWVSIAPGLGIEVARALITPDSVKFINRLNSSYFKGNFSYINELLQIEVNYQMIQAILLGNTYLHYSVENYQGGTDNGALFLSTLKKRKIKKENELLIPNILTQEIYYSSEYNKVSRMDIQDYRPIRKFSARYPAYESVDGFFMPKELIINAQAAKNVSIDLVYSRITLNKPINTPFSIPQGYEQIR